MRIAQLEGEKIGICVSGGLDSKSVTARLIEAGLDVIGFTADLAQPDEDDIEDIPRRMAPTGAQTQIIDLRHEMAKAAMLVIKAQARYDGGFRSGNHPPASTSGRAQEARRRRSCVRGGALVLGCAVRTDGGRCCRSWCRGGRNWERPPKKARHELIRVMLAPCEAWN